MVVICKRLDESQQINNLGEWFIKCPPERKSYHWQDGRSAKELAKAWTCSNGVRVPKEVRDLLDNNPVFEGTELYLASPEYETRFDQYGRGRKHDLLIIGEKNLEKVLITVEAKVDESFGNNTVQKYLLKASSKNKSTKVPERIEKLTKALFSADCSKDAMLLQYQLLHAVAGTLTESKKQKARKALFIVHYLNKGSCDLRKRKINDDQLDIFTNCLSNGRFNEINKGEITGPIYVPGNQQVPFDIPLYIGKIES